MAEKDCAYRMCELPNRGLENAYRPFVFLAKRMISTGIISTIHRLV